MSRCLEKNLLTRAQSALEVSNELRKLQRELERGSRDSGIREGRLDRKAQGYERRYLRPGEEMKRR